MPIPPLELPPPQSTTVDAAARNDAVQYVRGASPERAAQPQDDD